MKPFRELSRRSRLYRLRKLARVAINAYGMSDARLTFIQYGENIIYRVDLPGANLSSGDSSPYLPNRYVLRIHAMGDVEAISSSRDTLNMLPPSWASQSQCGRVKPAGGCQVAEKECI